MKKIIIVVIFIIIMFLIALSFTVPVKIENEYFEDVLFEWDDDLDVYDVSIIETNEKGLLTNKHYYVKTEDAILVYNKEEWNCYGTIRASYNIYGVLLSKTITDFHINVYYKEELVDNNVNS